MWRQSTISRRNPIVTSFYDKLEITCVPNSKFSTTESKDCGILQKLDLLVGKKHDSGEASEMFSSNWLDL